MPAYNGKSLNSCMHTDAKLQQDIVKVLCRWRCYLIVFTCDIEKMFRQILMHVLDRDWLRIVYDFGTGLGLQNFRLCTVTYDTACAPFQALRILKLLIELLEQLCPDSPYLPWLRELFDELSYVDDFFGGADTVAEAITEREALTTTLWAAKIPLGKWSVNHKDLRPGLTDIDQTEL